VIFIGNLHLVYIPWYLIIGTVVPMSESVPCCYFFLSILCRVEESEVKCPNPTSTFPKCPTPDSDLPKIPNSDSLTYSE